MRKNNDTNLANIKDIYVLTGTSNHLFNDADVVREVHINLLKKLCIFTLSGFLLLILSSCGCGCKNAATTPGVIKKNQFDKLSTHEFSPSGKRYPIYVTKTGTKPVLLLHELPGMTEGALSLALRLEAEGYKVYFPLMFGRFGQNSVVTGIFQTAISPRFKLLKPSTAGPITKDMTHLSNWISKQHNNQGITVIGNCLTGPIPIKLLQLNSVDTAVVCQPALPMSPILSSTSTKELYKKSLGISTPELDHTAQILANDQSKNLYVFQYADDKFSPHVRSEIISSSLRNAGVGKHDQRFKVFFGVNNLTLSKQNLLHTYGWVRVSTRSIEGHSTVTGADIQNGDRETFRELLIEAIK